MQVIQHNLTYSLLGSLETKGWGEGVKMAVQPKSQKGSEPVPIGEHRENQQCSLCDVFKTERGKKEKGIFMQTPLFRARILSCV